MKRRPRRSENGGDGTPASATRGRLAADRRAVTVQVGAVLLLGVLVVLLSIYQVTFVPAQNEAIEFRHSQQAQSQLQDVRNSVTRSGSTGTTQPASVALGVDYPARVVGVNPGAVAGTLRTRSFAGDSNVTVLNSRALDEETADYWNGTRSFSTREVVYSVGYNEYQSAPVTRYENTVLYNDFDGGERNLTGQGLIDGRRISVYTLAGSFQESQVRSRTIDVESLSPASTTVNTVAIEPNATGQNVTVTVPTTRSETTWRGLLEEELWANGGYVTDVAVDPAAEELTLTLARSRDGTTVTYDLRLARVALGATGAGPGEAYVTAVGSATPTLVAGETYDLAVEVRDRFNNPESGVVVTAAQESPKDGFGTRTSTTDEDGRVSFAYDANTVDGTTDTINVTIGGGHTAERRVVFDVSIVERTVTAGDPGLDRGTRTNVTVFDDAKGNPKSDFNGKGNSYEYVDQGSGDSALRSTGAGTIEAKTNKFTTFPERGDVVQYRYENEQGNAGAFLFGVQGTKDTDPSYALQINPGGDMKLGEWSASNDFAGNYATKDVSAELSQDTEYVVEIYWGANGTASDPTITATVFETNPDGSKGRGLVSISVESGLYDSGTFGFDAQGAGVVFDDVAVFR